MIAVNPLSNSGRLAKEPYPPNPPIKTMGSLGAAGGKGSDCEVKALVNHHELSRSVRLTITTS